MGNTPLGIVPARGSTSKGSAIRVEPLETTDGDDSPSWRIIAVSVFTEQTQAPRITTGALPTSHHASCCRPNRVSSKPGTHHRVRLTRRREEKRSGLRHGGQIGRRWAGAVDTPPRLSHAKTRRRERKRSGRRRGGQIRPVIARNDGERRVAGTHHTPIAASHTILPKHTIQPAYTLQPVLTIQPLHNTLEPGETI